MKRSGKLVLFVAVVLLVVYSYARPLGKLSPESLSALETRPEGVDDPCVGKRLCVAVYIAPWCPACKSALPFFVNLRSFLEARNIGFMPIIGQDGKERIDRFAPEVSGAVKVDYKGTFSRNERVTGIPHWFVWDPQGEIKAKFASGAPYSNTMSSQAISRMFVEKFLKIELAEANEPKDVDPTKPATN